MRVYTKNMVENKVIRNEVFHDLGITVDVNMQSFDIFLDNNGDLTISCSDQLLIKPKASNSAILEHE